MLSPNHLLISKLSCLNYTFIQLFTCQTFIWPTKQLCLTSDLQISKRNLQSHNEWTTPEPPYLWLMIHQVLRNLFSSADSHWYFICRSVTAAYSVITKPSCRSEGRSIFRVRCSPINTHYVSGGEVNLGHTHTHTVDISRPNESADARHVSVSDTHTAGFVSCSSWSTKTLIFKKLKSIPNFGLLSCVVDAGRRFKAESDLFSHRLRLRWKSFLTAAEWTQERKTISLHVEFCSTCWKPVNQCEDCEEFLCVWIVPGSQWVLFETVCSLTTVFYTVLLSTCRNIFNTILCFTKWNHGSCCLPC